MLGVVLKRALRARSFHAFDARHEEVSLGVVALDSLRSMGAVTQHKAKHYLSFFFFFCRYFPAVTYIFQQNVQAENHSSFTEG